MNTLNFKFTDRLLVEEMRERWGVRITAKAIQKRYVSWSRPTDGRFKLNVDGS